VNTEIYHLPQVEAGLYKVIFVYVVYSAGEGRRIISELNVNIVKAIK
jgi:hypothetical protein